MELVRSIKEIDNISPNVVSESIKTKIKAHFIEPFGSLEETNDYWSTYGCTLFIVNSSESDAEIMHTLKAHGYTSDDALKRLMKLYEYVLLFTDVAEDMTYILTMSINSDNDSGNYLLLPVANKSTLKAKLLRHFEITDASTMDS